MKCGRGTGNPDLLLFNWTVFFIGLFFTTAVFEKSAEDMYRVFGGGCLQVFLDTFGKKHRPRRRSLRTSFSRAHGLSRFAPLALRLQQRVALARSTRELLPQPLWRCFLI